MTKSTATTVIRRAALVAGYITFCAVGTVGAVELGTQIGSSAADMATIYDTADLVNHGGPVAAPVTTFAENETFRIR